MLLALLLLHGLMALLAPLAARRLGTRVFLLCALAPLATVVWAASVAVPILDGDAVVQQMSWVPAMGISFDLRLDGFALLMVALISGIGLLIFAYSRWYFSPRPGLGRFAGILTAFSGSMLGVVLADNLLILFLFWELTSITSYLLIGFEDEKVAARSAALQALLITGAGGLAMMGGFIILGQAAGTYSLSAILADPPSGGAVGAGLVLVLLGAFTKSAQVPFHSWLPGAMAAPTPVSAYLHSATMVKAGVYLIARFAPAFALLYEFWRPLVIGVGLATMIVGGLRALTQRDIKLLLAYGTVSQLGFMVVLVGSGHPALTFAGVAIILAHGLFKATLFMLVGIIDHSAHTRDLSRLSGLARQVPVMFGIAVVGIASMAGIPPLLGFAAKEAALEAVLDEAGWIVSAGIVVGSILTFAYGARFLWGAFARKSSEADGEVPDSRLDPQPAPILVPAAVLGALTLVFGLFPGIAAGLVGPAAGSLDTGAQIGGLYLWHGLTPALGYSALTVFVGTLLFRNRRRVERWQTARKIKVTAQGSYEVGLKALIHGADRLTGIVQNGSLPVYITVIMLTAVALPGWALLRSGVMPEAVVLAESWLQVLVVAAVLAAALWMAMAKQRFVAVILLGAVGFGVAVLFVMQGAPDLAMTQLLIETLAIIIFVLVLRHLPSRFESVGWKIGNAFRIAVAATVGVFVAGFALMAAQSSGTGHVAQELVERSYPDGGGRNVVNVILTDFRALDTLGEITVLVIAAFGIASLVLVGMREKEGREEVAMKFDRSLILSTSVDVVFPTALVFSLFLLFAGHNAPGGGFVGGLVAGAAFVMRYVDAGPAAVKEPGKLPGLLLGVGLAIAILTGAMGWMAGGEFLQSIQFDAELPVLGSVHGGSALLFDIGVYLVVVGLVRTVLSVLGGKVEQ